MKILLDTCILAELRHPQGDLFIKQTFNSFKDESLFISALTIGEIAYGIALLPESRRKTDLTLWLNGLEEYFPNQILAINLDTAHIWGEITSRAKTKGITIPISDGLIAATAIQHGLHIMTRNVRHFKDTGALLFNLEAN
jgi:predicted nucleic acid-binding protein